MAGQDRVLRAVELVDDDALADLVAALDGDERRTLAALLRTSASSLVSDTSKRAVIMRGMRKLPPPRRADVAHLLSGACLDDTIDALGEAADDPTRAQLLDVLPGIVERHGMAVTRLMLAATAGGDAPARHLCAELLDGDETYGVGDDHAVAASPPAQPPSRRDRPDRPQSEVDREARRAAKRERKQAQRDAQRRREDASRAVRQRRREARKAELDVPDADVAEPSAPPGDDRLGRRPGERPVSADGLVTTTSSAGSERRGVRVVGARADLVDDDPMVGRVVIANVPFGGSPGAKVRPAVVVGALRYQLVVRPCYSAGGVKADDWRSIEILDWNEAGLDGPSWVSDEESVVSRADIHDELGTLSVADWNRL